MKSVLFFGTYDRHYSRTSVLRHGFERNGWKVEECHVDPKTNNKVQIIFKLAWQGLKMRGRRYDLVLVGFPGQIEALIVARVLFGPKILFDAFLSQFDSNVFDRKVYGETSWRAKKDKLFDSWSCRLAGKVLLDTNEHINYFVDTFGVPREKLIRVFIGADDTVFSPKQSAQLERFTLHFHGTFIPLQGIQYILQAAKLLAGDDIYFRLVGSGQEYVKMRRLADELELSNVDFVGKVPLQKLPDYMAEAHIVLGIFGDTEKTKRVIPNKVYEAMAMGKPIITADTPALRELPGASKALSLIAVSDGDSLSSAIRHLKSDAEARQILGKNALELFREELTPEKLVKGLISSLS